MHGGGLPRAAEAAGLLLAIPREVGVLQRRQPPRKRSRSWTRGWLAIGPKRLYPCNIATKPERFARRLKIVIARSGPQRQRLLQCIIPWTELSAARIIGDGDDPAIDPASPAPASPLDR